jgi:hypothetical protein
VWNFSIIPAYNVQQLKYICMMVEISNVQLLRLLISRLERLSADSHWANRASGLRGNIVKILEEVESGQDVSSNRLELLTEAAFGILRRAAQDIPDLEELLKRR